MSTARGFRGFPSRTNYTPIPNSFFSALLPEIDDMAELKVTLYIFWALYRQKGYPKYITYSELRGDEALMTGIQTKDEAEYRLQHALEKAVKRGTLLSLRVENEEGTEDLYFLNSEIERRAIIKIKGGEIQLDGIVRVEPASTEERPNIFALYEQHVGLLTPMMAEDLKEAENIYPASWIEDAFREAVDLNKRSWRYISKILERWASEGKSDGRTGKDSKADTDPKEFLRRYGNLSGR
ncbi:MAG: DnaD domain protein [Dehalococcoidia bacterium]